jgi:3-isopropylmalate/(R)-2-methylmalate dehydratase small subunit
MADLEKITGRRGRGVVVRGNDIDTDQIIPARYMRSIRFAGLEEFVFRDQRFTVNDEPKGHPFDDPRFSDAEILVVNRNFGCGSSREHAVWAIRDFGFRVLISTSFADIFKENSFKNGVLTIELDEPTHRKLVEGFKSNPETEMTVDLVEQSLQFAGVRAAFTVNSFTRTCLLEGLDELGYILRHAPQISAFEKSH